MTAGDVTPPGDRAPPSAGTTDATTARGRAAIERRGDPLRIAGLGKDQNTKPCNQRIVLAN